METLLWVFWRGHSWKSLLLTMRKRKANLERGSKQKSRQPRPSACVSRDP